MKVVKGIGRAIGRVVKGAVGLVKKVFKSKLGKLVAGAALMFFGVPAVAGLFGGGAAGAAGLSGFAGASANISAAWGSLTGAASSMLAGNFAQAGTQLSTGMLGPATEAIGAGGASIPMGEYAGVGAAEAAAGAAPGISGAGYIPTATSTATSFGGDVGLMAGGAPAQAPGLLAKFTSSPYFAPAVVQAGGAVLQGIGQAKAAQSQIEYQQKLKDDELKRYNTNVGTRLWGNAPTGG